MLIPVLSWRQKCVKGNYPPSSNSNNNDASGPLVPQYWEKAKETERAEGHTKNTHKKVQDQQAQTQQHQHWRWWGILHRNTLWCWWEVSQNLYKQKLGFLFSEFHLWNSWTIDKYWLRLCWEEVDDCQKQGSTPTFIAVCGRIQGSGFLGAWESFCWHVAGY